MMKRTKAAVVLLAALLILSLCVTASADISVGISPPRVTMSDAVKGGTYEETVTIFYSGDEPTTFTIVAEGECSDWLSLYDEDDLTTPLDELSLDASDKPVSNKIVLKVDIPKEMANAKYNGTVFLESIPSTNKAKGAVAQAVVRMPLQVAVEVTGKQILKGAVNSITTADAEVGYPVKIQVEFENKGNVIAKPEVEISILKDGEHVDSFVHRGAIKPGCDETITALWNTTGVETGNYTADVTVSLDGAALTTEKLSFTVLTSGTLTREGELKKLTIKGVPEIDRVIKVVAIFENIGEGDIIAEFKGELYHNGDFVDVLESEEKLVEPGDTLEITVYYKITAPGDYKIKGYVTYSGKETQKEEVSFTVSGEGDAKEVAKVEKKAAEEEKKGIPGFEFVTGMIAIAIVSLRVSVYRRERGRL